MNTKELDEKFVAPTGTSRFNVELTKAKSLLHFMMKAAKNILISALVSALLHLALLMRNGKGCYKSA